MRAFFIMLAPIAMTWFGYEIKKAFTRYQELREQRERNRRRSVPKS